MTQAQHVPTTSWSPLPVAMAALALTATFSVAVILTQVGPATIDVSPDRVSVTATAAERAWEAQRAQVSASTFASAATAGEQAWEAQRAQVSASTFASAATAGEQAWEAQRAQVSEATYGAATGDVSGNLHSEYLIELFRRQAAAAAGADLEGNLHSEYLIEMFRRQAAAAETADDAPVEASSPRAPIAR